ncbi:hypothetical protein BJ875DRAFT_436269 [Amylocarpus encephaloides]|uniref:RING-type domain-containing protein n=1 Tax=Amylocarpus encephaloides TaxID=45428 RepID=A0A9P8CAC3_9HELO|nr:hypothetical protein BJ875DRAFT_436269 [Amylocarpus encephaloides]
MEGQERERPMGAECPICGEDFYHAFDKNRARAMPCQHDFCKACILTGWIESGHTSCPSCRQRIVSLRHSYVERNLGFEVREVSPPLSINSWLKLHREKKYEEAFNMDAELSYQKYVKEGRSAKWSHDNWLEGRVELRNSLREQEPNAERRDEFFLFLVIAEFQGDLIGREFFGWIRESRGDAQITGEI